MSKNERNRYIIFRIINNNVVTSLDEQEAEIVLMGKGISYHKTIGDYVDREEIEKIFVLKGKEKNRYLDVIEHIPSQFFDIAMELLEMAEKDLHVKASPIAFVMLADHIASAVERLSERIVLKNEMLSEIKHFYPGEYAFGKNALRYIEEKYGYALPLDEAGFLAFHIINLSEGNMKRKSDERMKLINKVIEIVETYFNLKLDPDSIYYERFLTHLKYFSSRVFTKQKEPEETKKDDFVYRMMKVQYPQTEKCVALVQEYLDYNYHICVSDEEKGYLMIHINNMLRKQDSNLMG